MDSNFRFRASGDIPHRPRGEAASHDADHATVVAMRVEDYYPGGKRWWVRLHEKGGKRHEMPAHHKLEQFLDEYLAAAGIRENGKTPSSVLTDKPMNRVDAYRMGRRRTADAGFRVKLGCHVFRATGITADLEGNGIRTQKMFASTAATSSRTARCFTGRHSACRSRAGSMSSCPTPVSAGT